MHYIRVIKTLDVIFVFPLLISFELTLWLRLTGVSDLQNDVISHLQQNF